MCKVHAKHIVASAPRSSSYTCCRQGQAHRVQQRGPEHGGAVDNGERRRLDPPRAHPPGGAHHRLPCCICVSCSSIRLSPSLDDRTNGHASFMTRQPSFDSQLSTVLLCTAGLLLHRVAGRRLGRRQLWRRRLEALPQGARERAQGGCSCASNVLPLNSQSHQPYMLLILPLYWQYT